LVPARDSLNNSWAHEVANTFFERVQLLYGATCPGGWAQQLDPPGLITKHWKSFLIHKHNPHLPRHCTIYRYKLILLQSLRTNSQYNETVLSYSSVRNSCQSVRPSETDKFSVGQATLKSSLSCWQTTFWTICFSRYNWASYFQAGQAT
jgi:hypothetical protein